MTEPSAIHFNPREIAEQGLARMTGAVNAQLQQLQTLQASAGGPSSMSVDRQITGLQLVKINLTALLTYTRQLEGQAAGLAELKTPPDYSDELLAIRDELHAQADSRTAPRLLELVVALQTAYAPAVVVPDPAVPTAPTATTPAASTPSATAPTPTVPSAPTNVLLSTYAAAWSDGYRAGYPTGWSTGYGTGWQGGYSTGWPAGRTSGWAAAYLAAWRAAVRATWDDVLARIPARL